MKIKHKNYYIYRVLEMIPGFLVWLTFALAIGLSVFQPIYAIYFIIIFDLYWFTKIAYLTVYLFISWVRYHKHRKIDWLQRVKQLKNKNWKEYNHLIFLPTYKEPFDVIDRTFSNLKNIKYPTDKMTIILAGEGRDEANFLQIADKIKQKYQGCFNNLMITVHPTNLPDEIPGKGSNLNYAGFQAKKYVDEQGWDYDKTIVSTFDVDTQVRSDYFSYLTYEYLTSDNPTRYSYQPLAFYHNNIWDSNFITRVVANSTTFWLLTDLARSERLFTFSSHSMSWRALVDIGFWQKDIVTEDSRIFLQCFIYYNGDYKVKPMFTTVSMDTVYMGKFWQSLKNQYKQMRRWAWGVEHFPYMAWNFAKKKNIPLMKKMRYLWNQTEGVYSWATAPIIIFIMGRLPLMTADKAVQATYTAQQAPYILETIMGVAMFGLVLTAILSTYLLPVKPVKYHWTKYFIMVIQWIIFPISMIIFGSIPATEAQTRLMLGGRFRLGFWVSEKKA
jgi:cellulose synthase/poly-beta-1,6-N-acetylglucosamine synthase-like glycosyltransferase